MRSLQNYVLYVTWMTFVGFYRTATAQGAAVRPCAPLQLASSVLLLDSDCQWTLNLFGQGGSDVRLTSSRNLLARAATTVVYAGKGAAVLSTGKASAGFRLRVARIVFVGFQHAARGSTEPFLWPLGLLLQTGSALDLVDVRLVTSDEAVLNSWLQLFRANTSIVVWTDNRTFIHVPFWSDGRTTLRSVGLLLQTAAETADPAQLTAPLVDNCIVTATNSSLVSALVSQAAKITAQPLLVYVTTNVSIGVSPKPPSGGIAINRPVVLVGLQTLPTSVDFQMVVNQLNATGSNYSNVTFIGLVLENLAGGDSISSAVAAPLSIAISNNVWAVNANRSAANMTRLVFFNTTIVVPQESEMAYLTYMFAMYTSPLPYLRQQTSFWSDVVHVSIVQFSAGPNRSIIVHRMVSWFHQWTEVVLTAQPAVAVPLPVPVRPVAVDTRRAAPLVTAVHTAEDLRSAAQQKVVGDRAYVLLLLSNISLNTPGNSRLATTPMTWIGSSWDMSSVSMPEPQHVDIHGADGSISFAYRQSVFAVQSAADDALQLQQVALKQLPQGPQAAAAAAGGVDGKRVPQDLWTILLWCIERPMLAKQPLSLSGVALQLPAPEYDYIRTTVAQSADFLIQLPGDGVDLTFQNASCLGSNCAVIQVASFQGPGMTAKNLTLSIDPSAQAAIPGYFWPAQNQAPTPTDKAAGLAPWAVAVIAVSASAAILLAAVGAFTWWRHRRLAASNHSLPRVSGDSKMHNGDSLAGRFWELWRHRGHSRSCALDQFCGEDCENCGKCLSGGFSSNTVDGTGAKTPTITGSTQASVGVDGQSDDRPAPTAARATAKTSDQAGRQKHSSEQQVHTDPAAPATVHDDIAAGLQRWRSSVSSTTLMLMQRRLEAAASSGTSSASHRPGSLTQPATLQQQQQGATDVSSPRWQQSSGLGTTPPQLQLLSLLGEGSFGSVYLGNWRGKRVAVKVMHLPASALLGPQDESSQQDFTASSTDYMDGAQQVQRHKRLRQRQQNSPPHMAVIEAVLSSTMCHPNVVQVYNYSLCPLTSKSDGPKGSCSGAGSSRGAGQAGPQLAGDHLTGWQLEIVMEYCSEGSLRDALDNGMLCMPGAYLAPSAVLDLAHDVAAALLHLHTEGIVHGDLKAGNVMLSGEANKCGTSGDDNRRVLGTLAGSKLTAKVADFGLSMPLDPTDTHATLLPRGTPTHMSPELFMSGHVSKASDVYAFGIMLYEIITGQRAYAGVPIPLLPHEVARQGLRPTWPADIPVGCCGLKQLAEACWAARPRDRPTFGDILSALDHWAAGGSGWPQTAALSASPFLRSYSAGHDGSDLPSASPFSRADDPTQQRDQQPGQGGQEQQDTTEVGFVGAQDELLAVFPVQGLHWAMQPAEAQMAAPPGLLELEEVPLSITPQLPNPARVVVARRGANVDGRDRQIQMSWSEVDINRGKKLTD